MFLLILLLACAPGPRVPGPLGPVGRDVPPAEAPLAPEPDAPVVEHGESRLGEAIAEAARHHLKRETRGFRADCSGFVEAVLHRAGLPLRGNTASLWAQAEALGAVHRRRTPAPGDLAFFDNTYDRNGSGRLDDPLTHLAVVLEVSPDGTILLAHRGTSAGRSTFRMNLRHPDVRERDGEVLNDFLRARRAGDRPNTPYLAGELWRGFATVRDQERDAWLSFPSG